MKNTILMLLGLLGSGCASTQPHTTDIGRMYDGKLSSGCVTVSSTAAYNQGLEAFAKSEWGEHIGVGCTADNGDGVDWPIQAIDVFDKDAKFVGRTSNHIQAQRVLLKAAKNFDYNQQCAPVYSSADYRPDGTIGLEAPLGENIGMVCNPSKNFVPEYDLCRVPGMIFDVYSFKPTKNLGPKDANPSMAVVPIHYEVPNPHPYQWVGEAGSCKEAQEILRNK